MSAKWVSKFQIKPGRWVFVPTQETKVEGRKIKESIEDCWSPPPYYYHLRSGGHVEALRTHLGRSHFLNIDIQDFFGSINASRVTRCLKAYFSYAPARNMAKASTVYHPLQKGRTILPFGFVQSQIIAALCLEQSALGKQLSLLEKNKHLSLSVYVDDIIVSCDSADLSTEVLAALKASADKAKFTLNDKKEQGPAPSVTAFNIILGTSSMEIDEARLAQFAEVYSQSTNQSQRAGILAYVNSINSNQKAALQS